MLQSPYRQARNISRTFFRSFKLAWRGRFVALVREILTLVVVAIASGSSRVDLMRGQSTLPTSTDIECNQRSSYWKVNGLVLPPLAILHLSTRFCRYVEDASGSQTKLLTMILSLVADSPAISVPVMLWFVVSRVMPCNQWLVRPVLY